MTDRLNEEKLTTLRRWGEGLTRDERDEVRAAGRAILLLSEEIERLHVDLWHAREGSGSEPDAAEAMGSPPETPEPDVRSALRDRLFAFLPQRD